LRRVLGATVWADGLERRTAAAAEFSGLRILGIATWAAHFSPTPSSCFEFPSTTIRRAGGYGALETICASAPCVFFGRRSCQIGRRTGPNAHQYQKDASQARLIRGLARQR
jgi:hypothetical protein